MNYFQASWLENRVKLSKKPILNLGIVQGSSVSKQNVTHKWENKKKKATPLRTCPNRCAKGLRQGQPADAGCHFVSSI
jgi:hypothetical protein